MAYAVIAGQTIPVMPTTPRRREFAVGEVRRAFSGAPRSSVRDYWLEWEGVETKWITRAQADTIRSALKSTPPLTVSGDMFGSVTSAYVQNIREVEKARKMFAGVNTEAVRLSFDAWEA